MKPVFRNSFTAAVLAVGLGALVWASTGGARDFLGSKPARASATVAVDNTPIPRDGKGTASYASVVQKVAPAVVNVFTTKTVKSGPDMNPFFNDPMFRRFFGDRFGGGDNQPRSYKERSLGSGVIVDKEGHIITNNHVVEGADEVQVALVKSAKRYTAKVVGRDTKTDIAVLQIDAKDLSYLTLGDSDKLLVGDVVLAVGNPFGIGQTVTMGIVSATGRGGMGIEEYEDFIQTDAAINPGNSGGALVDAQGRLVGINTAIMSRTGGFQGVGFAVPINLARNIMEQLVKTGKVVRGYMGVMIQDLTPALAKEFGVPESGGALVGEVTPNSPAAEAGVKSGDVVVSLNNEPVPDSRNLKLRIGALLPGTKATLGVLRDGKPRTLTVNLKQMPEQKTAMGGPESEGDGQDSLNGVTVGDLDAAARRQLGIPAGVQGAVILEVDPNSASSTAGLRQGDVIVEINRKPVRNAEEAVELSKRITSGRALVKVWSNGSGNTPGGTRYVVVDESKEKSKPAPKPEQDER